VAAASRWWFEEAYLIKIRTADTIGTTAGRISTTCNCCVLHSISEHTNTHIQRDNLDAGLIAEICMLL
jgi:hypothetical protein